MSRYARGTLLLVTLALSGLAHSLSGQEAGAPGRYRIQAALRDDPGQAESEARRIHRLLDGAFPVYVSSGDRHRVRVGDFDSLEEARRSLIQIRRLGYTDAWLARYEEQPQALVLGPGEPSDARPNGEAGSNGNVSSNGEGATGGEATDVDPGPEGTAGAAEEVLATGDLADGRGAFEGHHEASDCVRTAGWVWDRTRPDAPVVVEIYDGDRRIGTAIADVYRRGLAESEKGGGSHAFYFEHPDELRDGRAHELSVTVAGGDVALLASPRVIACGRDGKPLDVDALRPAPKSTRAETREGDIEVDGHLDDVAWERATFRDDFLQKGHDRGYPSRVTTEVAFLHDEEALYVAARMHAPADRPAALVRGRDAAANDDRLLVSLDTHQDRTTAYTFGVTEGGTRLDYHHPADREFPADRTFDPVWDAAVARDSAGWTAELRIPFSQLRFSDSGAQVWGLNVKREDPARFVSLYWVVVPTYETGWSSRFGELLGVRTQAGRRGLEVAPYVLGSTSRLDRGAGGDGGFGEATTRVGGDLKLGLGPSLTVDATFNPDFGQVEADPAEVNLTAFETFFPERRPFFQEGAQLLRGGGADYFYSRRVGGLPRGVSDDAIARAGGGATILGAAKLTGRLESGLSVGALTALTDAETVPTAPGDSLTVPVAPKSLFGVGRVQQEIGRAGSTVGLLLTGVRRDLPVEQGLAGQLARSAVSGGADWNLRLGRGTYEVKGHAGFSLVEGDSAAIDRLQRSSVHYYQRPDAGHVELDPARTSLFGATAGLGIAKVGGAPWLWDLSASTTTPGFELNDVGILRRADTHDLGASVSYRRLGLQGAARQFTLGAFSNAAWNHDGVRRGTGFGLFGNAVWHNFWRTYGTVTLHTRALSDDLTRGGPLMGTPRAWSVDAGLSGSHASPTQWSFDGSLFFDELGGWSAAANASVSVRPDPRLELSLSPGLTLSDASRQFFDVFPGGPPATYGQRYVFAGLDRSEIYARIRVGYGITPDLTLELYGEPFASTVRYHDFGELTGAGERTLRLYGTDGTSVEELEDGSRVVTDGADQFTLFNSDFRLRSFRSNAVLKWEWRRGSTLHLIWQQNRWYWEDRSDPLDAGSLFRSLSDAGEHVLVAKVSYWFSIR